MAPTPDQIGPYEILDTIALGGMGEVYLARLQRASGFEKRVAVKRTRPELAQASDFIGLFEREARIAAALTHRHIVQIFDFGHLPDGAWIAMEFVHGLDLKGALDAVGALPPGLAVEIALACAQALDYAWRAPGADGRPLHLIHRDVSPHNVLLSYEGDIKLADFGLARAITPESSGQIEGKLAYMSPEQAQGRALDQRSDLFSLGAVLYEALSGHRAFHGPDGAEAILNRVQAGRPLAPLAEIASDLPPPLVAAVEALMAPTPADRPGSAAAAARLLSTAALEAGVIIGQPALGPWLRAQLPDRRSPVTGAPLEPTATAAPSPALSAAPVAPLERTATAAAPLSGDANPRLTPEPPTPTPPDALRPAPPRRAWLPGLAALGLALGAGGLWASSQWSTTAGQPDAGLAALTPDAQTPDAQTPDAQTPDAQTSDAQAPDAQMPDAEAPDTEAPDAEAPDAEAPDAEAPDAAPQPSPRRRRRRVPPSRAELLAQRPDAGPPTQRPDAALPVEAPPSAPPEPPPKASGPTLSLSGPGLSGGARDLSAGVVQFTTESRPRVRGRIALSGGRVLLNLTAEPHGAIRLDGRDVGWTPKARLPLRPGAHRLQITTAEGEQASVSLDLSAPSP